VRPQSAEPHPNATSTTRPGTRWTSGAERRAAAVAPRISYSAGIIARDGDGNALGGIRLSEHHVPTAFNGTGNSGGLFCTLFGVHEPFMAERLAAL